jgi:hypothetical protein
MEMGTPPPEYTAADNSPGPVPLIQQVLRSPSPEILPVIRIPPKPTVPAAQKKLGRPPKKGISPPDPTMKFEVLIQITLPNKRVRQHGGKTKNEKREPIKRGPRFISVDIVWVEFIEVVAEIIQAAPGSLIVGSFEWHWLKPASGAWLPLMDEHGLASLIKQVSTKSEPYVILRMQPPRPESAPLVSLSLFNVF